MSSVQKDLLSYFCVVSDPRKDRTRKHKLIDILVITICSYICSADNWIEVVQWAKSREDWLKKFLELPNGIPSHDTFGRVFSILNPREVEKSFEEWITALRTSNTKREHVAIDGKMLRGSILKGSAIGVVSAWSSSVGVTLGYQRYDRDKKHEKKITEDLIETLYLKGCIVTLDAAGATQQICKKIQEKESDFVVALKGNQGNLHRLAKEIFEGSLKKKNSKFVKLRRSEPAKKQHGRKEKRHYELINVEDIQLPEVDIWGDVLDDWKTLIKSIGRVKSWRDGEKEVRYFFGSLSSSEIKDFSESVRGHWKIENQLHWVLDVAFREDQGRVRLKNAGENVAIMRRIALNILKQDKTNKIGIQAKRRKAGWDINYMQKLLENTSI